MPDTVGPNLFQGSLPARVDRVPAVSIADAAKRLTRMYMVFEISSSCTIVAMERAPSGNLDEELAADGVAALQLTGSPLVNKLLSLGVLTRSAIDKDVAPKIDALRLPQLKVDAAGSLYTKPHVSTLSNKKYSRVFRDIVYVFTVGDKGTLPRRSCACGPCLRYHTCEHMLFVESLPLPNASGTRDFSELPANRQRGRPRGSVVARGVADAVKSARK